MTITNCRDTKNEKRRLFPELNTHRCLSVLFHSLGNETHLLLMATNQTKRIGKDLSSVLYSEQSGVKSEGSMPDLPVISKGRKVTWNKKEKSHRMATGDRFGLFVSGMASWKQLVLARPL